MPNRTWWVPVLSMGREVDRIAVQARSATKARERARIEFKDRGYAKSRGDVMGKPIDTDGAMASRTKEGGDKAFAESLNPERVQAQGNPSPSSDDPDALYICVPCYTIATMRVGGTDCFDCGRPATLFRRDAHV